VAAGAEELVVSDGGFVLGVSLSGIVLDTGAEELGALVGELGGDGDGGAALEVVIGGVYVVLYEVSTMVLPK